MSNLQQVWDSAVTSPYEPLISKDGQFAVGFSLLVIGILLGGLFSLNRSFLNIGALGVPASLALGFGSVYMICAVGVYV